MISLIPLRLQTVNDIYSIYAYDIIIFNGGLKELGMVREYFSHLIL